MGDEEFLDFLVAIAYKFGSSFPIMKSEETNTQRKYKKQNQNKKKKGWGGGTEYYPCIYISSKLGKEKKNGYVYITINMRKKTHMHSLN